MCIKIDEEGIISTISVSSWIGVTPYSNYLQHVTTCSNAETSFGYLASKDMC